MLLWSFSSDMKHVTTEYLQKEVQKKHFPGSFPDLRRHEVWINISKLSLWRLAPHYGTSSASIIFRLPTVTLLNTPLCPQNQYHRVYRENICYRHVRQTSWPQLNKIYQSALTMGWFLRFILVNRDNLK